MIEKYDFTELFICFNIVVHVLIVSFVLKLVNAYFLGNFVDKVASRSPTRHFIIHARKALLNGLSPAENRKVPPLKYVCSQIIFFMVG